ncbi:Protein of unknown function (DUF1657) [Halobacteroides halobius DSM 5150]|uniref:DUF1657 domain-containing protein n=1 Tax=Halobacteroides halobius (strain ATCC 35273 / DSM 5150 / MD-1) TaxID=748449 RepID=L0K7G7_HALHC|nr:DUF1657 domain-containing protein [Halobacteroides halobius]AGB41232.1 Protein of unknown function (DUF1657) [Halobacteroides halobius DSM 5150]
MTVGDQLHQTLTSLEGAKTNLEKFALSTNDKQAQKMYNQAAQQVKGVANQLQGRVNYVEQEEPAYNKRTGATNKAQNKNQQ